MSHTIEVHRLRDADDDLSLDVYEWSNDTTGAIAVIDVVLPGERAKSCELTEGMAVDLAKFLVRIVNRERRARKRERSYRRANGLEP